MSQLYHSLITIPVTPVSYYYTIESGVQCRPGNRLQKMAYLSLDQLTPNPKLARRLPAELAWRFHALPLAEDHGTITVAMANPDDDAAREAVLAALGPSACVVQGDLATIDALLGEIWGTDTEIVNLAVCAGEEPGRAKVEGYATYLGELLGAPVSLVPNWEGMTAWLRQAGCGQRRLLLTEPNRPLLSSLLLGAAEEELCQSNSPIAVLVVKEPRWPIRCMLLVIGGERREQIVVDWVLPLARRSQATITVLAVVTPHPGPAWQESPARSGLPALLTAETPPARQVHQFAQYLADWSLDTNLRLRQGPPDGQIRREWAEGDYDMIAMAVWPDHWLLKRLGQEPLARLVEWSRCPLLLVRSD